MIVKYISKKEIERGGYQFVEITAEKADGTLYTKSFPTWDSDLCGKLDRFAPGEFLNLSYKQDKYKNLKDIKEATGFATNTGGNKGRGNTASGVTSNDSGATRGTDTNRSAAIYLAKEIVFKCFPKETNVDTLMTSLFYLSEEVYKYIAEGKSSVIEKELVVPDIEEE